MDNRRRAIMGIDKGGGRLPSEYQEVAYLQNTGTQYILTDIYLDLIKTKVFITCSWDVLTGSSSAFGCAYSGDYWFTLFKQGSSSNISLQYRRVPSGVGNLVFLQNEQTQFTSIHNCTIQLNNGTAIVADFDGNTFTATASYNNYTPQKIGLFCRLLDGVFPELYSGHLRIYKVRITTSSAFYDFTPCYRKSDNKPGLYEAVNDMFYTNAATSGADFIFGPDVN